MSTGSVRSLQRIEADQFPTGTLRRPRRRGLPASFGSLGVLSVCATESGEDGRKLAACAVGRHPAGRAPAGPGCCSALQGAIGPRRAASSGTPHSGDAPWRVVPDGLRLIPLCGGVDGEAGRGGPVARRSCEARERGPTIHGSHSGAAEWASGPSRVFAE